ncbi:MAG: membrane integrity-associated transporter subunit PqiC [Spirochaetales bacterium]|nr:membrane integrity-associated transporter subunit PqiC [Leptospiraceae bacterium]MCP5481812.1 membrane integrity-associated transporter subunit PqiC [Spirochaetales bacterium]
MQRIFLNLSRLRMGALISIMCVVVGCLPELERAAPEKRSYAIELERQTREGPALFADLNLEVQRFQVERRFSDRPLVYRTGEVEYEADFYNEFLVAPGSNLEGEARRWLDDRGLFRAVLGSPSRLRARLLLETAVEALYGDFRDSPAAVLEMHVFLLTRNGEVLLDRRYARRVPLESRSPEALVRGYGRALEAVLGELEQDIRSRREAIAATGES